MINWTLPDNIFISKKHSISVHELLKTTFGFPDLDPFQESSHQYIYVWKSFWNLINNYIYGKNIEITRSVQMQYIYNYLRGFPLLPSPPLPRPSPSPPPPPPLLLPDLLDFCFDSGFVFVTGMHVMASSTTALWLSFSTFALNTNKSQSRNAVRYYRYYTHFKSSDSLSRNEHSSVFSSSPLCSSTGAASNMEFWINLFRSWEAFFCVILK